MKNPCYENLELYQRRVPHTLVTQGPGLVKFYFGYQLQTYDQKIYLNLKLVSNKIHYHPKCCPTSIESTSI